MADLLFRGGDLWGAKSREQSAFFGQRENRDPEFVVHTAAYASSEDTLT